MSYKCNRCIIFRGEPRGPCEISLKTLEHDRKIAKFRIRYRFSDVLCINAYRRRSSITHFVIPAPYTSSCDKIQISNITFIFLIFVRPFQAIRGSTPFAQGFWWNVAELKHVWSPICATALQIVKGRGAPFAATSYNRKQIRLLLLLNNVPW